MAFIKLKHGDELSLTIKPPPTPPCMSALPSGQTGLKSFILLTRGAQGPITPGPPCVAWQIHEDGSFKVFTATQIPDLEAFRPLEIGGLSSHLQSQLVASDENIAPVEGAVALTATESHGEAGPAAHGEDGKPKKYSRREA
ncbi:hypothetical protein CLAIMM_11812 isoform 1 [Cladophialophora immunda]|nr:hypothetical protein CLAIMM_11812 isoform 1 [Cladophialophora immunda]